MHNLNTDIYDPSGTKTHHPPLTKNERNAFEVRVHHYTRSSTNSTLTTVSVDRRLLTSYVYTLQTWRRT